MSFPDNVESSEALGQTGGHLDTTKRTFLARGSAADVWLIESQNVGIDKYVSKIMRLTPESLREDHDFEDDQGNSDTGSSRVREDFIQEFSAKARQWSAISHENIVQVFGLEGQLDLRVEYCHNGVASQYLQLAKSSSDAIERRKVMIDDVLKGMEYLHTRNPPIIHGHLSMSKLFVDDKGTTKLGEFGLAALTRRFALFVPSISQAGLSRWMSPELVVLDPDNAFVQSTTASDVWALGCTLFEIISGRLPYSEHKHELRVRKEITSGKHPGRQELSIREFDFIWPALAACWEVKQQSRFSVAEIRESITGVTGSLASRLPHSPPATKAPSYPPTGRLTAYEFTEPSQDHGYLAQLEEWANHYGIALAWQDYTQQVNGISSTTSYPLIEGVPYQECTGIGPKIRLARARAAEMLIHSKTIGQLAESAPKKLGWSIDT